MAHDTDITAAPPTTKPATGSAATERMRLDRERRRKGLRCVTIELRATEIDALIRWGLLKPEMRNYPNAVTKALYAFFDRSLGSAP